MLKCISRVVNKGLNAPRPCFNPLARTILRRPTVATDNIAIGQKYRSYSSNGHGPEKPKFRYMFVITLAGTIVFILAEKQITLKKPRDLSPEEFEEEAQLNRSKYRRTSFKPGQVGVISVIGGPGSGKTTQCNNLVRDYKFVTLSIPQLLAQQQGQDGSKYGKLIDSFAEDKLKVPDSVLIALIQDAMRDSLDQGNDRFLIEGFPEGIKQAMLFEEKVSSLQLILNFECPEDVLIKRFLKRGHNSSESQAEIKNQAETFNSSKGSLLEYFDQVGKVVTISCDQKPDRMYKQIQASLKDKLGLQ